MTNYFEKEIPCKCCGISNANRDLVFRLNAMREIHGFPITATSICRCVKHNLEVGGKTNSAHITTDEIEGKAADIFCKDGNDKLDLVEAAILAGFKRIIVYRSKYNLIHLDVDETKPQGLIVES